MRIQEPPRDSRKLHPRGSRRLQEASGGSRSPCGRSPLEGNLLEPAPLEGWLQEAPGGPRRPGSYRKSQEP